MTRRNSRCGIRYTAATKAKAVDLWRQGKALPEIEAATGASRTTISRWLDEAKARRLPPGSLPSRPEITTERAIALWREHGTASAAARAIGMHPDTFARRANSETFV